MGTITRCPGGVTNPALGFGKRHFPEHRRSDLFIEGEGGNRGSNELHLSDTGGGHHRPYFRLHAGGLGQETGSGERADADHRQVGRRWRHGVPQAGVPGAGDLRRRRCDPARRVEPDGRRSPEHQRNHRCLVRPRRLLLGPRGLLRDEDGDGSQHPHRVGGSQGSQRCPPGRLQGRLGDGSLGRGSGSVRTRDLARGLHEYDSRRPRWRQRHHVGAQSSLRILARRFVHRALRACRRRHLHQGR